MKLLVPEKGPKWFWVSIYRVSKSVNVKRNIKDGLLMHTSISTMSSLPSSFLPTFFFFFFFFSLNLSFFLLSSSYLLFMATSLPFILLDSMGFLPFVPKTSPTIFWFLVRISLGLYPLTHWFPAATYCSECAC